MKIVLKIFFITLISISFSHSEENNGSKWSFYTGTFDFSDDGKKATLFGIQHINDNLYRESFIGTLQPVTGGFITADNAVYVYTGFQIPNKSGSFTFTPSFTPGLYSEGDGKDLGHVIEFKTEIQISFEISDDSEFGLSYNHISNASLGSKNPGANSYMFNYIKKF
tara:strand:+ start:262 stop:759 length:498 start_codon:yes stop_codon:yes gene_type:complete